MRTGKLGASAPEAFADHAWVETEIRSILEQHGQLPGRVDALSPSSDLFAAGMTSHASISVMLALEEHFEIEFPDHMLKREVFASIASLQAAVAEVREHVAS